MLADRVHVWVVESPENTTATEAYWASAAAGSGSSIESGITKFTPSGETAEDWCVDVIDSLDLHHNGYSHEPGYTALEVYGVAPSARIAAVYSEYGFTEFQETESSFVARKQAVME